MSILTAHFAFNQNYIPPRHRLPHNTRVRAEALVTIKDLTEETAPIVARITSEKGVVEQIRHDGSNFLRPMLGPDGSPMTIETYELMLMAADKHTEWKDYPFAFRDDIVGYDDRRQSIKSTERVMGLEHKDRLERRRLVDSNEDEARAEVQARSDRMRSIDGAIYIVAPEPTWLVVCGEYRHANKTALARREPYLDHQRIHFRLDDLDAAERFASMAFGEPTKIKMGDGVEILNPAVFKRDDLIEGAKSLARAVIPHMAEFAGAFTSIPAMRAWCDLREAADAFDGQDRHAAADLFEKAREIAKHGLEPRNDLLKKGAVAKDAYVKPVPPLLDRFIVLSEILSNKPASELEDAAALSF